MQKTKTAETRLAVPLIWDAGPLEAALSSIRAPDIRTGTTYFVEPVKSEFSGHRLWKAYCLPADVEATDRNIKAARDTTARRFKSLAQAKDACNQHATVLSWPQVQVAVALTYWQFRVADRAIEEAKKMQTQSIAQQNLDQTLLAAIEKQLPLLFKQWRQQNLWHGTTQQEENVVHVLLSEPGLYDLFRCLSLLDKQNVPPKRRAQIDKLQKALFRKIAAHEQRIVDA